MTSWGGALSGPSARGERRLEGGALGGGMHHRGEAGDDEATEGHEPRGATAAGCVHRHSAVPFGRSPSPDPHPMPTTRKRNLATIATVLLAAVAVAQNAGHRLVPEDLTGFVTGLAMGLGLCALVFWGGEARSLVRRRRSA